jgi:hypothetical protein
MPYLDRRPVARSDVIDAHGAKLILPTNKKLEAFAPDAAPSYARAAAVPTAGDTVAFATALLRCGSKDELAKDNAPRLRLTIGLRKIGGAWKIAHEHHSFPREL